MNLLLSSYEWISVAFTLFYYWHVARDLLDYLLS
jgi:hypothetical protein